MLINICLDEIRDKKMMNIKAYCRLIGCFVFALDLSGLTGNTLKYMKMGREMGNSVWLLHPLAQQIKVKEPKAEEAIN